MSENDAKILIIEVPAASEAPATRTQRRLVTVSTREKHRGNLWGYGYETIAHLAGCSPGAVRQAHHRGSLDPSDFFALVAWIVGQKNKHVTLDAAQRDAILGE